MTMVDSQKDRIRRTAMIHKNGALTQQQVNSLELLDELECMEKIKDIYFERNILLENVASQMAYAILSNAAALRLYRLPRPEQGVYCLFCGAGWREGQPLAHTESCIVNVADKVYRGDWEPSS